MLLTNWNVDNSNKIIEIARIITDMLKEALEVSLINYKRLRVNLKSIDSYYTKSTI